MAKTEGKQSTVLIFFSVKMIFKKEQIRNMEVF